MLERCRASQDGCTLLHVAAQEGHASVVELLLAAGADKDAKNAVSVITGKLPPSVPQTSPTAHPHNPTVRLFPEILFTRARPPFMHPRRPHPPLGPP